MMKKHRTDFPSPSQKKFEEATERAQRTLDMAEKALEGHPIPHKAVIVSKDKAYRDASRAALADRSDYEIVAVDPDEAIEPVLKGSVNVVFLLDYNERHLEALSKCVAKKVIAVASEDDTQRAWLHDLRAIVVKTPLSPEMMKLAF